MTKAKRKATLSLDGLDDIPWAELTHAYGDASDVPALLRGLARGEDTTYELFGNIYHQGTVYEATSYAVPFLTELLEVDEVRMMVIWLLASIAEGTPMFSAATQEPVPLYFPTMAEFEEACEREAEHTRRAHHAVAAGLDTYRDLRLRSLARDERVALAALLGRCGDAETLDEWLASEPHPKVRASIVLNRVRFAGAHPLDKVVALLRSSTREEDAPLCALAVAMTTEGVLEPFVLEGLRAFATDRNIEAVTASAGPEGIGFLFTVLQGRPMQRSAVALAMLELPDRREALYWLESMIMCGEAPEEFEAAINAALESDDKKLRKAVRPLSKTLERRRGGTS